MSFCLKYLRGDNQSVANTPNKSGSSRQPVPATNSSFAFADLVPPGNGIAFIGFPKFSRQILRESLSQYQCAFVSGEPNAVKKLLETDARLPGACVI